VARAPAGSAADEAEDAQSDAPSPRRAVEWNHVKTNAAKAVQMPRENLKAPRPFESPAEVDKVADAMKNPTHRALVLFACKTGLRPQEWQALKWTDLDRATSASRSTERFKTGS